MLLRDDPAQVTAYLFWISLTIVSLSVTLLLMTNEANDFPEFGGRIQFCFRMEMRKGDQSIGDARMKSLTAQSGVRLLL